MVSFAAIDTRQRYSNLPPPPAPPTRSPRVALPLRGQRAGVMLSLRLWLRMRLRWRDQPLRRALVLQTATTATITTAAPTLGAPRFPVSPPLPRAAVVAPAVVTPAVATASPVIACSLGRKLHLAVL